MPALEIQDPGAEIAALVATSEALQAALAAGLGWSPCLWGPTHPDSPAARLERASGRLASD